MLQSLRRSLLSRFRGPVRGSGANPDGVQVRPLWRLLRAPPLRSARRGAPQTPVACRLGTYQHKQGGELLPARVRRAAPAGIVSGVHPPPTSGVGENASGGANHVDSHRAVLPGPPPPPASRRFAARGRGALARRRGVVFPRGPQPTRRRPWSGLHSPSAPPPTRATHGGPRPAQRPRGGLGGPLGARRHAGEHRFRALATPSSRAVHI